MPSRQRKLFSIAVIAVLLLTFGCNAWLAVCGKCATADEALHVASAFTRSHYHDFRLDSRDAALTVSMLWVAYALYLVGLKLTLSRLINLLLATAVCANVKFSGLLCAILVPAALLIRALLPQPWSWRDRALTSASRVVAAVL